MTDIQERPAGWQGKFTPEYPELGTGPVNYEDSISEEFFDAERKAVFERTWLCVGRMERLPRKGTYFTRELPGGLASIVITRGLDGNVYAFHNVCAHRGNKVVWQEHPGEESSGSCRQFACKYHGWRYGLDGGVNHVTNEEEFFDLDKSKLRMPPVHCEVLAGFIFVNLAEDPVPLRTFLGEGMLEHRGLPVRSDDAALRVLDADQGQLEARRRLGVRVVPPAVRARPLHRPRRVQGREDGAARRRLPLRPVPAAHADLGARAAAAAAAGTRDGGRAAARSSDGSTSCSGPGCSDPTTSPTSGRCPSFLNRGDIASWGNDQFWLFPNISIQIWARNYYITYTYWPETVGTHIYEIDLYFVPPANAHERLAQELVVDSTIEFAMQDVNTIEATHSALETRAQNTFHLSDQELLIRQFHTVIRDTVAAHQPARQTS